MINNIKIGITITNEKNIEISNGDKKIIIDNKSKRIFMIYLIIILIMIIFSLNKSWMRLVKKVLTQEGYLITLSI
jgi:hypothetical protein